MASEAICIELRLYTARGFGVAPYILEFIEAV